MLAYIIQTIPTTLAFPTTPDGTFDAISNSNSAIPASEYIIQDDFSSFNITANTDTILETRAVNSRDIIRVDCDHNNGANTKLGYALAKYIAQGVKHLNGVSGTLNNGPGPGNCGRAPRVRKELRSYGEIAWAAQEVQKRCYYPGQSSTGTPANVNNNGGYLKGAVYLRDQWSVTVRADHDNC